MGARWLAALIVMGANAVASAAPTAADVQRSLQLRAQWRGLTEDVAWPAQWSQDGRFHYRKTIKGGQAFMVVDPRTQVRAPAFDARRLAAGLGRASEQPIDPLALPFEQFDYVFSAGVSQPIAMRFGFEEQNWRCDLAVYQCSRETPPPLRPRAFGVVRDLAIPADPRPKPAPDARQAATVDGSALVITPADGGRPRRIDLGLAPADILDPQTISWSPDSRWLVLYRVTPGDRRIVTRVETSPPGGGQPVVRTQLYPKPGDAVDIERPVLIDVAAGRHIDIDTALLPNPYRLGSVQWRADSRSFSFTYIERGFQLLRVVAVGVASGRAHAAVTERSRTFIPSERRFQHEVDAQGDEILWISERDGWRHLYMIDGRTGSPLRQLTRGQWIVRDVLKVDDRQRRIWFSASGMDAGKDPYFRQVFSVGYDGRGLTRLTYDDGDHDVAISDDLQYYVDTWSRPDLPPRMSLHRIDGTRVQTIEQGDISALQAAGWRAPESFVAKGRDGRTDIWGMVVRPRDYDPAKRYPVIENIYAGPHDAFVPKTFWPFGYHSGGDKMIGMQSLADLGFIVVQIDGMGTAHRSKAFHDVAWKNLGDSGFPDRIAWHKALAARDPSYDISRVGIYGASAGGQSTLGALLFHPDFYAVGVAFAGCFDNRMDKISWNEQWMGWPVDASYARASGVVNAGKLQGDLLLIVGEQDSNVDPASTQQVVDALIQAGKDFDLLYVPGGEHSVGRSTGPIDYIQRRQFDFFVRHLGGAPTPHWNSLPAATTAVEAAAR